MFKNIVKIENGFSEKYAKLIFKKILLAFNDLHKAKICHRDITIENILLDENYDIKISSFSINSIKGENSNLNDNTIWDKYYFEPEIVSLNQYILIKGYNFRFKIILISNCIII